MIPRQSLGLAALALVLVLAGCERDLDLLGLAPFPADAEVFTDQFAPGVTFQAFAGSKTDALDTDTQDRVGGSTSLRVEVPAPGDPSGGYAGGAFVASTPRDLTGYDALTFWAKASVPVTLNTAGLGNDNTGTSRYVAEVSEFELTSSWQKFVIPIPDPSKLVREAGLFYFAEGAENDTGYDIWFDDIQFESLETLANPRPSIPTETFSGPVGATLTIQGISVVFDVAGTDFAVTTSPSYLDYSSSDESVATVDESGLITIVGEGSATVSASLDGVAAEGSITVETTVLPGSAAPTPTQDAADVISLYSDAYTDVAVDTWSADFDNADVADVTVDGDNVKAYTSLTFAAAEFTSSTVDASDMTHFRMDIWTPDPTADPAALLVKLVDFGADDAFQGGDDSEHELTFTASTTPALATGTWVSLDVPLSDFTGLTNRASLAQLIISGDPNTLFVDNVYFYAADAPPPPTEPTMPAPTPTRDAGSVVSMFSDAYTDVTVDTWRTGWTPPVVTLTETDVSGNAVKLYEGLGGQFLGIETLGSPIDASSMTGFTMDIWTPDPTTDPAVLRVKLVDLGADATIGTGDDVEHEVVLTGTSTPALGTGSWVTLDIPLADFVNLTTTGAIGQLILSGDLDTVYVDNVYFYSDAAPTEPTAPAPTPTRDAGSVVSMFSDVYSDVTVDTWRTGWTPPVVTLTETDVSGNAVKLYEGLGGQFLGIETLGSPIDASSMTGFTMDIWTPDGTADPVVFRVKLVDLGADATIGTADDVEHEVVLTATSTPALGTGSWVSLEIPLSDFTNLTTTGAIGQLILSGDLDTIYVDNVYFYN